MTVRVDLYSAAGAKLDVPPLVGADILGCQYSMKIGNIGTFTLTLAADATSAQNATAGRVVWIYDDLWPVFKGVIRTREIGADKDGRLILTLVGPSIADQLIGLTTGRGLTFENQSLSAVVTSLCADTDFEAGEVDTATITARRFDGRTKWDALAATAQAVDSSLREDLLGATPQIDIGVFGESSGITLRNFPESSQSLSDNAYMKQVASLKVKAQSLDLCNRVIPWGQIEGLSGSQFNLRQVSPDSPTNTRLYLPSVGAGTANIAPISAAFHSDWAATPGNYRLSAGLNPVSSAMETQNRANAGYSMLGQYVFGPIAAQTISGNISGQMRVQEASAAYNHQFRINVRVFDGDAVLRGTLLAPTTVGTEFSDSALTNHSIPSTALASLAVEDGDYIVIEIGRGSALGQADFRIGDAATNDLPVDQTSTTDGRPWIEFDSWVPIYTDLPSGLSYPVLSDTGPDGNPYYYIEDTASQAIYGVRERWVQFKDILPLGLTANDFVAAAQTLYGMAVTYLTRHLSEQLAYEVDALGLKHVNQANGAAYFEVGDTFRLQFDGWTQDEDGTKTNYLTVDTDLYLLDFTRTFNADGSDTWKLTLATFLRALPTDGEAFRQLAQAVGIEQSAPPWSGDSGTFTVSVPSGSLSTTTIQAAIDAARDAGGGTVSIPAGVYVCGTLTMYSNVHLVGAGINATTLQLASGTNAALIQGDDFTALAAGDTTGGISDWSIQSMTLDGNKANNGTTGYGIRVYGYRYILRDLAIKDFFTNGIYSQWGSASSENMEARVDNVRVYATTSASDGSGSNVYWLGPHDSIFTGCLFFYGAAKGFEAGHVDKAAGLLFNNCHAYGNHQTYGFHITGDGCSFSNCVAEGAITANVYFASNNCRWMNGYIFAAGASAPVGIETATTVSGYILSGLIINCTSNAVKLTGTDGGNGYIDITAYQTSGAILGGTPAATTDYTLRGDGGGTGAGFVFSDKHLGNFNVKGNIEVYDSSGNSKAYWQGSDGAIVMGGDVALYRSAANVLQTDDQMIAGDGFRMKMTAGVPTDADTTVDADGIAILDTSNSRIYFRVGGTWKYAALT